MPGGVGADELGRLDHDHVVELQAFGIASRSGSRPGASSASALSARAPTSASSATSVAVQRRTGAITATVPPTRAGVAGLSAEPRRRGRRRSTAHEAGLFAGAAHRVGLGNLRRGGGEDTVRDAHDLARASGSSRSG